MKEKKKIIIILIKRKALIFNTMKKEGRKERGIFQNGKNKKPKGKNDCRRGEIQFV